ncbi:putative CBS domain-containing protein [Rosa chinensis]|uniref:Putative CBS domain-containing protein n=1 Tax=Rosa chinensis TaxID=74649 RepID=A0A2P6QAZ6_ROSCH|nr:CBS domain-containing protein CBSX5 isoform X2 [Rosa chinensis]PRQ31352.1 putative CBS domain-containing protein [Rosa chinensis]
MAVSFLRHEVSDLCLGKPALRSLSISATVADAVEALRISEDNFISVWDCNHHSKSLAGDQCRCVGKLCMVDVICYLSKDDNLSSPSAALKAPVSEILTKIPGTVMHVDPSCSLLQAIDLILQGNQNLVVPIQSGLSGTSRRKQFPKSTNYMTTTTNHNGQEFCWLTQEDVIRFLLSSIGVFSPMPALSIDTLGIINTTDILAINYHSPASSAVQLISQSLEQQTSVAVVDMDDVLIGEISPFTLACCDESVAAVIATLSCGELMDYIDCGGPPEHLIKIVTERLKERKLQGALENYSSATNASANLGSSSSSSSSDEESSGSLNSTKLRSAGRFSRSNSYSARMVRRSEAIVCHPKSSLVAVMIQAIAHRVNYVWVIEDDYNLVGIVTFSGMLEVFREHLETMI